MSIMRTIHISVAFNVNIVPDTLLDKSILEKQVGSSIASFLDLSGFISFPGKRHLKIEIACDTIKVIKSEEINPSKQ